MSALELALRLGAWLIGTAFVLALSRLIHRQLPLGRPGLNAAGFILLCIFVTTLLVFLTGQLGLLRAGSLAALAAGGLGLMAAVPSWRKSLSRAPDELRGGWFQLRVWWNDLPRGLQFLTAAFGLISLLRFAFLIWAVPPFVWDSLTYHLTNVAHWTQAGRIELFETPIQRIYTPANYEVLAAWFTVFLHHDACVEAAGLPAYLLALLAVHSSARSLGCSRPAAWMGAMAFATTPALLLATTGTKNDPHVAAYYLFSLALILDLTGARQPGASRGDPDSPDQVLGRPARSEGHRPALSALVLLALTLLLGGYWNLRNWVVTGNPFYPYGVEVEGARVFPGAERTARLDLARLGENLASLAVKFGDAAGPIEPDLPDTTGWGWFFYGLGLPAVLWMAPTRRSFLALIAGFLISLLVLLLSVRPSPFNMRYLLWLPAAAGLAYAGWVDGLPSRPRLPPVANSLLFGLALALNLAMTLNYNRISPDRFGLLLERPLWERQAALLKLNMPSEYEHAVLFTPSGELLGYNVGDNGFVYPLYRADYSQRLVFVPLNPNDGCTAIAARMAGLGARYLFVAEGHTPESVIEQVRACAGQGGSLAEESRGLYVLRSGE